MVGQIGNWFCNFVFSLAFKVKPLNWLIPHDICFYIALFIYLLKCTLLYSLQNWREGHKIWDIFYNHNLVTNQLNHKIICNYEIYPIFYVFPFKFLDYITMCAQFFKNLIKPWQNLGLTKIWLNLAKIKLGSTLAKSWLNKNLIKLWLN